MNVYPLIRKIIIITELGYNKAVQQCCINCCVSQLYRLFSYTIATPIKYNSTMVAVVEPGYSCVQTISATLCDQHCFKKNRSMHLE